MDRRLEKCGQPRARRTRGCSGVCSEDKNKAAQTEGLLQEGLEDEIQVISEGNGGSYTNTAREV